MGYTHYWKFIDNNDGKDNQKLYDEAKEEIKDFVNYAMNDRFYNLAAAWGKEGTLPVLGKYISFNGVGEESHETFYLEENFINDKFNFCKTARKEYDDVVVGCLLILKKHLNDSIKISSDGDTVDTHFDFYEGASLIHQFILHQKLDFDGSLETLINFSSLCFTNEELEEEEIKTIIRLNS